MPPSVWPIVLAFALAAGCAEPPQPKKAPPAPPPPAPAPAPAPPVSADSLPPSKVVEADGFTLTQYVDGRVRLQTTTLWKEPYDTTFDNCEYYRGAFPVLERALASERVAHLSDMCAPPEPPPPAKGKKAPRAPKIGAPKVGAPKLGAPAKAAQPAAEPQPAVTPAPQP